MSFTVIKPQSRERDSHRKVGCRSIFARLSASYDPSIHWLDGSSPAHPYFDNDTKIQSIVAELKDDILAFALEACQLILDNVTLADEIKQRHLSETLSQIPDLWRAVILTQHYGVIYFMSRFEARTRYYPLMNQNPLLLDAIDIFLRSNDDGGIRVINYAVHALVTRGNLRVDYATSCVPPNAIAAVGPRHVLVRAADFNNRSASEVLACSSPMWDLHDFAHLTCAALSQELYGNKYQDHLLQLPKPLTALIRSPGLHTATGPLISDGLVFSELLTKLFTDTVAKNTWSGHQQTYQDLCMELATALAEYYLAKRPLEHPSTGRQLMLPEPISLTELAVLVQNKNYELPASEIEQRVFTRGGPSGAGKDVLLGLSARRRAARLAESTSWGYFEVRNTIKHRAHKEAYRMVCESLMERAVNEGERKLLEKIRDNLDYKDWEAGKRIILWDLVYEDNGVQLSKGR
ncbi:hypothetical protein F5Y09DRAFT_78941 [Xylaria sp. FL1042]|nr:hypothetical protein F5Y09DRAFT_78941 [Xylaria sp. FL1042]